MSKEATIAYFSMEIAIDPDIPTYSGGLGVLAGDTIRSAADLGVPMVAVTLLYRKGYFYQRLDDKGKQTEEPVQWVVDDSLEELPERATVTIEGRSVAVRPWLYRVEGVTGYRVAVYFLDTDLPENSEEDRKLTDNLYGGDQRYRLCQEVILGIGGVRMLDALGCDGIKRFHMNEGHAALLTLELLAREARKTGKKTIVGDDIDAVREQCIFTTHTPVPAGHDKFSIDLMADVIREEHLFDLTDSHIREVVDRILEIPGELSDLEELRSTDRTVNMTLMALNFSHYINGVAKKHGEVARMMFAEYPIHSITNGVHAPTWVSGPFRRIYDRYIPGWRQDAFSLRYALSIPKDVIWNAHAEAKEGLIDYVNHETNTGLSTDVLTIGFARRAATYKRGDLFFSDPARLREMVAKAGPLQLVFAGKAHPRDQGGKIS
jgi:starch phosphorylase